ncbi:MAG: hypothetical protein AB1641_22485 [Thermodesulfobacteriota bacterium]
MRVLLARSNDLRKDFFNAVHEIFIECQGPLDFEKASKPIVLEGGAAEPVSWEAIFAACKAFRQRESMSDSDFLVLLMSRRNSLNWFSSCDPEGARSIFIHAADWETYIACQAEYPVAFQVAENILQCLMFDTLADGTQFFHDPPIGCVNDMCSWKPDITFKFRTADVCPECQRVISEKAVPQPVIGQLLAIFESLRVRMLFRAPIPCSREDGEFPFPIAITCRKISGTTEPFRKFLMLLDHFDSLVRCTVITGSCIAMSGSVNDFFLTQGLHERPSLGHWVEALRILSQRDRTNVPELPSHLLDRVASVVRKAEDAGIVSLRNERRGHGYCDCNDTTYRDLFYKHVSTINDIENLLRPMYARTKWCYTTSITQPSRGTFMVGIKDLSGDHPDFIERTLELRPTSVAEVPETDSVYVVAPDNGWYTLTPYVLYRICPACGHHRVLVCDGEKYIDPYVGHRVQI